MRLLGRAIPVGAGGVSGYGEVEDGRFFPVTGDIFGDYERDGESVAMSEVVLGTPIDGVRFVNVMGGFKMPDRPGLPSMASLPPMWLPKATNFPCGEGSEIQLPSVLTGPVQIEAELAVVVGRRLRKADPDESAAAIMGWSVFNDVTATEYGEMGFWAVGKSIDGFTAWGPWIRTDLTEDRVMQGLAIIGHVNGVEGQAGNTAEFKFRPSEVISHVSHRITLFPGDVIALGTPYPAPEATIGDTVTCEVEEVGVLTNYLVAETKEMPPLEPRAQSWSSPRSAEGVGQG